MKHLKGFNFPADNFRHGIDEPHVFDNFLEDKKFLPIFDAMKAPAFPWRMSKILDDTEDNYLTNIQMAHMFYDHFSPEDESINLLFPILEAIDPVSILKIKANVLTKTDSIHEHGLHNDIENRLDCPFIKTAILYMNTCNGYTKFSNGEQVDSVQNRFVVFPNSLQHTGSTTTNSPFRMVININYI